MIFRRLLAGIILVAVIFMLGGCEQLGLEIDDNSKNRMNELNDIANSMGETMTADDFYDLQKKVNDLVDDAMGEVKLPVDYKEYNISYSKALELYGYVTGGIEINLKKLSQDEAKYVKALKKALE